jgi:hypothetical protein
VTRKSSAGAAPREPVFVKLVSFIALGGLGALVACAGTPPAVEPPPSPALVSAEPTASAAPLVEPTPPTGAAADPDVIRCGVDDSPVPVTRSTPPDVEGEAEQEEPPLRAAGGVERAATLQAAGLRSPALGFPAIGARLIALPAPPGGAAALSSVKMTAVAAPAVPTLDAPSLERVFAPCGELAVPDPPAAVVDTTTVAVTFGPTGAPRTARLPAPLRLASASKLARCLVERACALGETASRANTGTSVVVTTTVAPPVFTGTVEATFIGGEFSQAMMVRTRGLDRPGGAARPRPGAETVKKLVKEAALVCARRLPPRGTITFETGLTVVAGAPTPSIARGPTREHATVLSQCVEDELRPVTAPRVGGKGTFIVSIIIEPHPNRKRLEQMGDPLISEQ